MAAPPHLHSLQLEALFQTSAEESRSLPADDTDFDWDDHFHMTREGAVSPHRYSVDLNSYLDADGAITVTRESVELLPDEDEDPDFRASLERMFGAIPTSENMETTPERKRWYRSSRPISKLQRKSSAVSRRPSNASSIDPALLMRRSPIEFEENYTVPPPPPTSDHPALRPPAARNASDGTGRKSSMSLEIPRPSSSFTRRGSSTFNRPPSRPHPALSAARSIRQRVARARPFDPLKPFATPAAPQTPVSPLPVIWTVAHDRAICVLDARNYNVEQSIRKLRRAFPELVGCYLSPSMVERRLQVLDQNPEIDYFRVGLDFQSSRSIRNTTKGARSHARLGDELVGRLSDRLPSSTSTGSTGSTWSSSETSGSSSSPLPLRSKTGRRKAGAVLGFSSETSLGKGGRPMSIIDERPGSVVSCDSPTALPVRASAMARQHDREMEAALGSKSKERDREMDYQRTGKTIGGRVTLIGIKDAGHDEQSNDEVARRPTGLRKLANRGIRIGSGSQAAGRAEGRRTRSSSER